MDEYHYTDPFDPSLQEQHFGLSVTRDDGVLVRRSPERGSHQTMEQNQRPATLPKLGKLEELVIKAFASPFVHVFNYGHSWHSNKHSTAFLWYERYFDEPTSIFLPPSLKPSVEWTEITRCANIYRVPPNGALGSSPLVSLQGSAFSAFLTVGSSVFLSPWKFSSCRLSLRTNFPTRR